MLRLALETLAVLAADFVLLRVWAPNLVNLHQDIALAGAVLCFVLALVTTLWLVQRLWRRWPALRRHHLRVAPRDSDRET